MRGKGYMFDEPNSLFFSQNASHTNFILERMKNMNKKLMSLTLAAAIAGGTAVVPAGAEEAVLRVSAPEYYKIVDENKFYEVSAPENGVFKEVNGTTVPGGHKPSYGAVYGTFKSVVSVSGGAEKDVALIGAVYDENKALVSIKMDEKETAAATADLTVTNEIAENQTFKSFIWEQGSLKPIETDEQKPDIAAFYCDDPKTVTVSWYNKGGNYTIYKNGEAIDSSALSTVGEFYSKWDVRNISDLPMYIYTDTAANEGDTYVVKNGDAASDTMTARFDDGAYIKMDKYVIGRNMSYLRNNDNIWTNDTISKHVNYYGKECDEEVVRTVQQADGSSRSRGTIMYFTVDPDYLSGAGNAIDVTVDYLDVGTGSIKLQYYNDGNTGVKLTEKVIAVKTNSNEWKQATARLYNAEFLQTSNLTGKAQLRVLGATVSNVSVAKYENSAIENVYTDKVYSDGIIVRWSVPVSSNGVTGYTLKRDGQIIAEHLTRKVYADYDLSPNTEYAYSVIAEYGDVLGEETTAVTLKTAEALSIMLPTNDGDEAIYKEHDGGNGLSFFYNNSNINDDSMNIVDTRGGKPARVTGVEDRTTQKFYNYYNDGKPYPDNPVIRYTTIRYKVDSAAISADERNIAVEFDYFDDANIKGKTLYVQYLAYNNGEASKAATKNAAVLAGDNTWKTAKVVLTDAQFDHNATLFAGYDFRIGISGEGGFATTNAKVYAAMPQLVGYANVNADGTALETKYMTLKNTEVPGETAYDQNVLFSGKDYEQDAAKEPVDGKHFIYNTRYNGVNHGGNPGWREWKNAFYFDVDSSFLQGTSYDSVTMEIEYYAPNGTISIVFKNADGKDVSKSVTVAANKWSKAVIDMSDVVFGGKMNGGADFRINSTDCQGYINNITIYKNLAEYADQNKVTKDVYLMGDSICAGHPGAVGWGSTIGKYFNDKVNVYNYATAGASTKTYAHYDTVKNAAGAGDYVFIQFGHNDSMTSAEDGRGVDTETYKANLTTWINELNSKGAVPVLLSSVAINREKTDGKLTTDVVEPYRIAMKEVADTTGTAFIDVYAENKQLFNDYWTADDGLGFYISDGVHLTAAGAEETAKIIARGIANGIGGLARYVSGDTNPTIPTISE